MTGIASQSQLRMSFLRYALFTVPAVLLLGTLSGRLSNSGYGNAWFDALTKPGFMPPGWAFGAAWTILYILLGLSLAMLLHARGAIGRERAVGLFVFQLALNFSWSPVFFLLHRPSIALSIIAAMVVLTAALTVLLMKVRPLAALLLFPYLAWLLFAAALNYQIVALNPGAETLAPAGTSTDIRL
jgi:benzodiazapine receptor